MKLKIEFTPQELDYIATILADRPWKEANALLANLQAQVQAQQPAQAAPHTGNGHDRIGDQP
jgi:hypothetical protein